MAKAPQVSGLRRRRSLHENGVLIVEARLNELLGWRHALEGNGDVGPLHDMRIAAKRLRYALEILEICFPSAEHLIKEVTGIQEDLGVIHDLDVLTDLLRARLRTIDDKLLSDVMENHVLSGTRSERFNRLRGLLYNQARDRNRLGQLALLAEKIQDRKDAYETFRQKWGPDQLDSFAERVRQAVASPSEEVETRMDGGEQPAEAAPT